MDPSNGAQDVIRCDLSDKDIATEYGSKIKELIKPPSKVQVSMQKFNPNPINTEQHNDLTESFSPLSTTEDENGYRLKKTETSLKELLKNPILMCTINSGRWYTCTPKLHSVTYLNDEEIWISIRDTNTIKCINIQGSFRKSVTTIVPFWFHDLTVSSDGALFFFDFDGMTWMVNKITRRKEVIGLPQGWKPVNLCITQSNDLLVVMYSEDETQSKVVRYSGFTEKQTIQFDNEGKLLYSRSINGSIKYISENRNLDICVADCWACAVVVVSDNGNLRFRYTGHPSSTKNKPFKPYGIRTDSQGHILTADFDNHCIHILDKDGQFISYIDNCELRNPYGLCVNKNDDLFVAEYHTGNVKKIKYLE